MKFWAYKFLVSKLGTKLFSPLLINALHKLSYIPQQKIPTTLLNTLQHHYSLILIMSLSIFWKYIYLAAHISKYLFLHFSYIILYTFTTPLHITHYNSSKLHSHTLLLWNSTILLPINTSQYSSPPLL